MIPATWQTPGSVEHALALAERGYAVFPLQGKVPVSGSHGFRDAESGPEMVRALWARLGAHADGVGIATGPASGIWVLDVDVDSPAHPGARGAEDLEYLLDTYGELPQTYEVHTGSGGRHIYFQWVPGIGCSTGKVGQPGGGAMSGLDIKGDGGYVVASASVGDRGSAGYRRDLEMPAEVAEAPGWLLDLVRDAAGTETSSAEPIEPSGTWGEILAEWTLVRTDRNGDKYYRHPKATKSHSAILHPPSEVYPDGCLWNFSTNSPGMTPNTLYGRRVDPTDGLIGEIEADIAAERERAERRKAIPVLPDEFWDARPALSHIRQAARSMIIPPDSFLGAVLARLCVATDWRFLLPAAVGAPASMNLIVGMVGAPGQGKGTSLSASGSMLELHGGAADHVTGEIPVGSGEGFVHAFFDDMPDPAGGKTKVKVQTRYGMLITVNEVQTLTAVSSRTGQTTMQTLRSAWSGEQLGGAYASADKKLTLGSHHYRMALVIGVQPEHGAPILADSAGGTPQRIVWFNCTDPGAPDVEPSHPGRLRIRMPNWGDEQTRRPHVAAGGHQRLVALDVDPTIVAELKAAKRAANRGDLVEDNPHERLLRLKVAGTLAVLDERTNIDRSDWHLAGIVIDTSNAVRASMAAQIRSVRKAELASGDEVAARRDQYRSDRAAEVEAEGVQRVSRWIVTRLATMGPCRPGAMKRVADSKDRRRFDEALMMAEEAGEIVREGEMIRLA